MTMITPSYLGETIEYSSLHACRSTLEDPTGENRRMGLAKSGDGVHWERDSTFIPVGGDQSWNRAVLCDPSVELSGDSVRVWFGGGDIPAPDHGIHGQIGLGVLRMAARGN